MTFEEWWGDCSPYEDCKNVAKMAYDSRDAEVAELKAWNSELAKHQDNLADRCDQLRDQVTLLRDALHRSANQLDSYGAKGQADLTREALAATEPAP